MPVNQSGLEIGRTLHKVHNGTSWALEVVETGFKLIAGDEAICQLGRVFSSLTAAAQTIKQDRVNGWAFFGLTNPNMRRRSGSSSNGSATASAPVCGQPKGKCKHEGCYEPCDCKHGFCHTHCTHTHRIGSYSSRSYPMSNVPHVGVELEVVYGTERDYKRGVTIDCHQDGSLGSLGAEYKLLAKSTEAPQAAAELAEELWKRRANVNRQCGLHVHLDTRQINQERISKMLDWFQATQDVWYSLVPPSRRNNHYACRMETYNRSSHTTWAHTTSYNTVEIRIHAGTLNPFKLIGWLTALIHVQNKANDAAYVFPNTGDATEDFWTLFDDCPTEGKEYLRARINAGGQLRDTAYRTFED